jgi:glycosyltransferase involved in cell wall biosynthesis
MHNNYVLITSARDEEQYIENTIKSVIAQTVLPLKWIIVNDRSVDGTEEIITKYIKNFEFITLINNTGDNLRNFGSKAKAIQTAFNTIKNLNFNYIGNLDADITLIPNYYEKMINIFENNSKLGIAGGELWDFEKGQFKKRKYNLDSVSGTIQFFRRDCYEQIGGYLPLPYGGIDAAAEVFARMYGWEVKTFRNIEVYHHRPTGSIHRKVFFRKGLLEYSHGHHPLFEISKCIFYLFKPPYIIGSIQRLYGYYWGFFNNIETVLPEEVVKFQRKEQLKRIFPFIN